MRVRWHVFLFFLVMVVLTGLAGMAINDSVETAWQERNGVSPAH